MPIPVLLAGLGLVAGAAGIGGHLSAKETNERAQEISEDAQELYEGAKVSLESAQKKTESSLLKLGYSKKEVLESSMEQFLKAYERVKHIELKDSIGLNELSKFAIDQNEAIQLREMCSIYQSTFSSGATGVATGAVIALAASGSLPVVTGVLSTAGTALAVGEVGLAAGLAGSALSFGAAMTPLAAIAAPALLFTGISSSIKADENLEKARTMYAEAEAAAEKMKISETICKGISDRSEMFNKLLLELNHMFSECTYLLDNVTRKKTGLFKGKTVDPNKLTEEEVKLIAVTRSLAGAVKAVIDTPILSKEGNLSIDSQKVYDNTSNKLTDFTNAVKEVKSHDYNIKNVKTVPKKINKRSNSIDSRNSTSQKVKSVLLDTTRNISSLLIAFIVMLKVFVSTGESILWGSIAFTTVALLIMNNDTNLRLFKLVKNILCVSLAIEFGALLYSYGQSAIDIEYFLLKDIVFGLVSMVLFGLTMSDKGQKVDNFRKLFQRIFVCLYFSAFALFLLKILSSWIGFSFMTSIVITEILFMPFALFGAFSYETQNA